MAMVAAGIANQGVVMKPYIVDSIQSPELETLKQTEPEEYDQAISPETADQVTQLMVDTVDDGHRVPGRDPRRQVAGKTGTAQSGIPTCRRTPGSSRSPRPRTPRSRWP